MNNHDLKQALAAFQDTHAIRSARRIRDLYAVRQVLVRVQKSRHAGRFRLKGGMLIGAVLGDYHRTTRDADLLDQGRADPDAIRITFQEIVEIPMDNRVQLRNVEARLATREADGYDGVKVTIGARVAGDPASATIDIGYGDAVVPPGKPLTVPPMFEGGDELEMPSDLQWSVRDTPGTHHAVHWWQFVATAVHYNAATTGLQPHESWLKLFNDAAP